MCSGLGSLMGDLIPRNLATATFLSVWTKHVGR